jgi:deoxycytidylate deaminase
MNAKDEKYMKVARAVSNTSNYGRVKIGSAIVKKNRVIAVGCNEKKTHPIQKKYDNYLDYNSDKLKHCLHAEIATIISAKEDLQGSTIYIYRKDRSGNLNMCRPCNACLALIKRVGIKRMVYTIPNGYAEEFI